MTDTSDCSICLDPLIQDSCVNAKVRKMGVCGHFFHDTCIREWLKRGGEKCPLCRSNLKALLRKPKMQKIMPACADHYHQPEGIQLEIMLELSESMVSKSTSEPVCNCPKPEVLPIARILDYILDIMG